MMISLPAAANGFYEDCMAAATASSRHPNVHNGPWNLLTSVVDLAFSIAENWERVFDDKRPFAARIGQDQ